MDLVPGICPRLRRWPIGRPCYVFTGLLTDVVTDLVTRFSGMSLVPLPDAFEATVENPTNQHCAGRCKQYR